MSQDLAYSLSHDVVYTMSQHPVYGMSHDLVYGCGGFRNHGVTSVSIMEDA